MRSIDHAKLIEMLSAEFPEVRASFDDITLGLLHCEMGAFARLTEEAMDRGDFWKVEKYFRFVERVWADADEHVDNAIQVSYLESLAFSEFSERRYLGLKRMPSRLRETLLAIDGRKRWD